MSNNLPETIYDESAKSVLSAEQGVSILKEKKEIAISEGSVNAQTLQEMSRVVTKFLQDGAFPKSFQNATQALSAWLMAEQLGLKPLAAIQQMAVINGVVSMWGELPMALVQSSGALEDINLFVIDDEYKLISFQNKNLNKPIFASVCHIKRKGQQIQEFIYTVEEAKQNPNFNKDVWKKYQKTMMLRRVRAQAIKFTFPDMIMGAPIAEYNYNMAPDLDVEPSTSLMAKLENGTTEREENQEQRTTAGNSTKTVFDLQ